MSARAHSTRACLQACDWCTPVAEHERARAGRQSPRAYRLLAHRAVAALGRGVPAVRRPVGAGGAVVSMPQGGSRVRASASRGCGSTAGRNAGPRCRKSTHGPTRCERSVTARSVTARAWRTARRGLTGRCLPRMERSVRLPRRAPATRSPRRPSLEKPASAEPTRSPRRPSLRPCSRASAMQSKVLATERIRTRMM